MQLTIAERIIGELEDGQVLTFNAIDALLCVEAYRKGKTVPWRDSITRELKKLADAGEIVKIDPGVDSPALYRLERRS